MDPRNRQRVEVVSVRPTVRKDVTNAELVEGFCKRMAATGGLSRAAIKCYRSYIEEAVRFTTAMIEPEGVEKPPATWTKETIWAWIHYAETNFCGNFRLIALREPFTARCKANVWEGAQLADEVARAHCTGCPRFRRSTSIRHRLHALEKWFGFLAREGAVSFNFVSDVRKEWYEENPDAKLNGSGERKRNPRIAEQAQLVNGTTHPRNRAHYACAFKWRARPNELFWLDRYQSFGLPLPPGHRPRPGHDEGFRKHPELRSFEEGGDLVYLPEKMDANGNRLRDKRKGNRWFVVDPELRPILEQYLAWWERVVQRNPDGTPRWTDLWLNEDGSPVRLTADGGAPVRWNERTYFADAERLGLMKPGDREDPLRKWTGHCQRHSGERQDEENEVPSDWINHFRGDAVKGTSGRADARHHYYRPDPLVVRDKYRQHVPLVGFKPIPEAPRLKGRVTEAETHRAVLKREIARLKERTGLVRLACVRLRVGTEDCIVSARALPSVVFAFRAAGVEVAPPERAEPCPPIASRLVRKVLEEALGLLSGPA